MVHSLNCRGTLLTLETPKIMGILNATPDSFFNQGTKSGQDEILVEAEKMIAEGASILDVGGMSSRPGAEEISEAEEIDRVIPILQTLHKTFPDIILSIDTYRKNVAQEALNAGVAIINDISGGQRDRSIINLCAPNQAPFVCMHMLGTPSTMQINPLYNDVIREIYSFFNHKIIELRKAGLTDIILDPGFGFGKTVQHNYFLLKNLAFFKSLNCPVMVGISRKSMIYKPLQSNPSSALNGTTVLHTLALLNGADILRVHDVAFAKECITLTEIYKESK